MDCAIASAGTNENKFSVSKPKRAVTIQHPGKNAARISEKIVRWGVAREDD